MWYVVCEDELYHHGILGQKWGIRRFQNRDGSLTAAGRKRYDVYRDGTYPIKTKSDAIRGSQTSKEKERSGGNGKKIAVALGTTVAAVTAAGLYAKYHKEINALVKEKSTIVAGRILTYDMSNIDAFGERQKLAAYNISDTIQRKASSNLTKAGMIGREFAKNQKGKIAEAINKGLSEGSNELTKAGLIAIAGIGTKKLADAKERYDQSGSKNKVAEVILDSGNKGIESFISSIKNSSSSSNNSSNNGKANGKAGATVGKDLANKLGPAKQEQYSPQEQKRYDRLFQDNNKVKGNDDVRLTVKALKRAGYSIDQIETYLNGV